MYSSTLISKTVGPSRGRHPTPVVLRRGIEHGDECREFKTLDLESADTSQSEEEIRVAAQTDKVVRGVNGGLARKARKLRPLAGLIIIALVLAAAYMRHGLASRNKNAAKQSDAAKIGVGPATTVEKGMLSDQARNGLDIGQFRVPESIASRSSIANGQNPGGPGNQTAGNGNGSQTSRSLLLNTGRPRC